MDLQIGSSSSSNSNNNSNHIKQQGISSSSKVTHLNRSESAGDETNESIGTVDESEQKHHVGPVMGIFFKVWSLVKVTKMRNHQKLRRQQSDEPGQFQYISGAQLEAAHKGGIIEEHPQQLKRAVSQPPVSVHGNNLPAASSRLQVLGSRATSQSGAGTGTNSTSSGVSSTASCQSSCQSSCLIRRQQSAYSLRRGTGEQQHQVVAETTGIDQEQRKKASWASKIRRSATSVNQSDLTSYVSRYKAHRRQQQQKQEQRASARLASSASSTRLFSGSKQQFLVQQKPATARFSLDASNQQDVTCLRDDDEDEEEDEYDDDVDDEDSNDIYSTPNDSILSVPGSAALPVITPSDLPPRPFQPPPPSQQQPQRSYNANNPMIKSFSTTSFNQLLKQQVSDSSSSNLQQVPAQPNDSKLLLSSLSARPPLAPQQLQRSRQLANGSRFFISSSSSEDSTSAVKQQQQQLVTTDRCNLQVTGAQAVADGLQSCSPPDPSSSESLSAGTKAKLNQVDSQRHLALQSGVHFHAPVANSRPNSLAGLLVQAALPANYASTITTPSGCLSPLGAGYLFGIAGPKPVFPNASQLHTHFGQRQGGARRMIQQRQPLASSISLHDCQRALLGLESEGRGAELERDELRLVEYKLAQALLESGDADPDGARDEAGNTALMLAILADNQSALRCLIERGANPDRTNHASQSALDLACSRAPTRCRLELVKILIDGGAQVDLANSTSGRLLDRLIGQHQSNGSATDDKLAYIECLLQAGAKLGSTTWLAAQNKPEIQVRLLRKLCQDGYFLYKKSSIEAAVYRFEYALRRIAELEQQLPRMQPRPAQLAYLSASSSSVQLIVRQLKFQTYLGLSRCERKRKFYKRALEFAQLAILIDSTAYEGYYSKAHILRDLGEVDDALMAIYQTARLLDKSSEFLQLQLAELEQHQEALLFQGAGRFLDGESSQHLMEWDPLLNPVAGQQVASIDVLEWQRSELLASLDYLREAKRFVDKLKAEIMEDKLASQQGESSASFPVVS